MTTNKELRGDLDCLRIDVDGMLYKLKYESIDKQITHRLRDIVNRLSNLFGVATFTVMFVGLGSIVSLPGTSFWDALKAVSCIGAISGMMAVAVSGMFKMVLYNVVKLSRWY